MYAARGLRRGSAEITAVVFTAYGGWQFHRNMRHEVWKSDIFQVASDVSFHQMVSSKQSPKPGGNRGAVEERKYAEFKLRGLNADSCVN